MLTCARRNPGPQIRNVTDDLRRVSPQAGGGGCAEKREPAERKAWDFGFPSACAGACFKQGNRAYWNIAPGRDLEYYLPIGDHKALLAIPLGHPPTSATCNIERSRQCIAVVDYDGRRIEQAQNSIGEKPAVA
jgi:hypothetical protein